MSNEKKRKSRNNRHRDFDTNIKEKHRASSYELLEPLPHTSYFVNRLMEEETLKSITRTTRSTNEFTLDTESVNIPGQGNVPALIQLLMILDHRPSLTLIVEMHYLPREHQLRFELIKELFQVILSSEKTSYIFESKNELKPFVQFELFSPEQIESMKFINAQDNFKQYWRTTHSHRQENSTNNNPNGKCVCESCIGKKPRNPGRNIRY